jgi:hypothetical protein
MRTEPRGRKVRPVTDITSTALREEEMGYMHRLIGMNSFKEGAM